MESKNENWILNFQKRNLILDFFFIFKNIKGEKKNSVEISQDFSVNVGIGKIEKESVNSIGRAVLDLLN